MLFDKAIRAGISYLQCYQNYPNDNYTLVQPICDSITRIIQNQGKISRRQVIMLIETWMLSHPGVPVLEAAEE